MESVRPDTLSSPAGQLGRRRIKQSKQTNKEMVPSRASIPERFPTDFCSSGTCPKINQYISFAYDPDIFQTALSVLGLRVSELLRPFKGGVLVSYSLLALQDISLTGS